MTLGRSQEDQGSPPRRARGRCPDPQGGVNQAVPGGHRQHRPSCVRGPGHSHSTPLCGWDVSELCPSLELVSTLAPPVPVASPCLALPALAGPAAP